jgi:Tfp pilus assembly PilM family ATPase
LARFLALDWDHQELHVVSANVGRGGISVQRAAVWQVGKSPNPAEAEELGLLLRDKLREAGMAPAPVLISIGRDRVIVKEVRYPQVAATEEPALVRFQASKDLTYPAEEVVIDYTPVGDPAPTGERRAAAVILRRELLDAYQTLCRAAGLKLAGITPRPFGIAACVKHLPAAAAPAGEEGAAAVLTVTGQWAEFCVVRDERVLFARSMTPGAGLVGEIRRNLALYAGQPHATSADDRVQTLYVAGNGEHNVLREQLQALLAIPVHPLDPFAQVERLELAANRGGFTGAVGLLHIQAGSRGLPIDFASPKEPRPVTDPNRRRRLALAGLGVAALLLLLLMGRSALATRDQAIAELREESENLDNRLGRFTNDTDKLQALQGWTATSVSWLDELATLSARFPDTKVMHLKEVTASVTTGNTLARPAGKNAPNKFVAQVSITGEFKSDETEVHQLIDRLAQTSMDSHYRIAAKNILPRPDDQTPGSFTTRLDIEKLQPPPLAGPRGGKQAGTIRGRRQP